jgi:type IV pilus assembly protein PilQ
VKNYQYLGIIGSVALVSLITQPVQSANTEIIDIKSEKREHSLELKLDTVGTQQTIPKITTYNQDKTLIATLPNLQLGKNFSQKNPYPGISKIEINQGKNNNINVKVTGEKQAPSGSIFLQQSSDLLLSFIPSQAQLLAQNTENKPATDPSQTNNNTPTNKDNVLIPNPTILINGQPAGAPNAEPPAFLPRAVAPPVGDIAVSNIDSSPITLELGKNIPVRRLVLKDAPVREVLGLLARSAGINLIFTDGETAKDQKDQKEATISLDIDNEPIQDVFNSVLLVGGLQANLKGNTIFVGKNLPQDARNLISRTLRLNQVSSASAAAFLATQGASAQRLVIPVEEITDPVTQRVVRRIEKPATLEALQVKPAEGEGLAAPLLLRGLTVTTDDRLNSITLVGEPRQVEMATSFLTQLDARRRQVAVNLKIVDVNLANQDLFNSSVSFGVGDGFFVSDNGAAVLNYGGVNPPSSGTVTDGVYGQPIIKNPLLNLGGGEGDLFLDQQTSPFSNYTKSSNFPDIYFRPGFGTNSNPFQPGVASVDESGLITYALPSFFQYPSKFLALLEAKVVSGNAKILTDPTLMVQEGQEATVKLVQEVITSVKTEVDRESNTRTITPEIGEAGLSVTINVDKIDDNGFINLSVSPKVSAIGRQENFDSGDATNEIALLNVREISSGTIRLRDGQTLILSGVIQESDKTTISKVPILGDIPLLGALFRSTNRENSRTEVIVLVTPQIVDDSDQSGWGYNYSPGPATRDALKKQGLTVPGGR